MQFLWFLCACMIASQPLAAQNHPPANQEELSATPDRRQQKEPPNGVGDELGRHLSGLYT